MAFSFFYLLESCLLIANALAILSDRFLKQCNKHSSLSHFHNNFYIYSRSKRTIQTK